MVTLTYWAAANSDTSKLRFKKHFLGQKLIQKNFKGPKIMRNYIAKWYEFRNSHTEDDSKEILENLEIDGW